MQLHFWNRILSTLSILTSSQAKLFQEGRNKCGVLLQQRMNACEAAARVSSDKSHTVILQHLSLLDMLDVEIPLCE